MIRPPNLKKGDKIGLIAPSRMITRDQMNAAYEIFADWGLDVVSGKNLFSQSGYFAGTDEDRKIDLQQMINDPEIKAIFCARGGYGLSRIIDSVDLDSLTSHPKWVIGFSDITALHLKLFTTGIESIHGLMPVQFGYEGVQESLKSLENLLFKESMQYEFGTSLMNKEGKVQGKLIGGNLSLIVDSLGTSTEIKTVDKILYIEEIDEFYYKIDRMFNQLRRAGKFVDVKGIIIGQFSDLKDTQIPFGQSLEQIVLHHLADVQCPIAFGIPFGHESHNLAIPNGRLAHLEVSRQRVRLFD